jgi:large subunit ribosomal protein L22
MNRFKTNTTEAKAFARSIRMSPHKIRRVVDQIRGRSYEEALMILQFMPYKACEPVLKLLYSAAANAKNNFNLNKSELIISEVYVDQGPVMKRFQPRAQGRGYPILKPTSHVSITVTNVK